ncbi:MAG: NAD-dependent epimerase/dehydratase family protein [Candidatus Woesearchaeota archaeon]|jgi:UDP-glucose 4-epimerase
MKILVTGGAGFIGSHVVDAYIEQGHTVVVVDSLLTGQKKNINPHAILYTCDITSPDLFAIFEKEKPDIVNHHAAQMNVHYSVEHPINDAHVNILGLLNVLQCCVKTKVKKIIFISSGGAMYGDTKIIPTPESIYPEPLSPYGLAKFVGEEYVKLFHRLYGLQYSILRYANVYGPRQNPKGESGVVSIFIDKLFHNQQLIIYGDGKQTRDYIFVADVVQANVLCLTAGDSYAFNIGTGKEMSVIQLLEVLLIIINKKSLPLFEPSRSGEVARGALDCSLAKKIIHWQPQYSLREGIEKTVRELQ